MSRIVLTDQSGRWFDSEKAEKFEESRHWNGSNYISDATGSQWDHEALYRTSGGKWILHSWSQYQGIEDSIEEIANDRAAAWLSQNGYEGHPACKQEYADLEII